jgi:hypothetical protein
MKQAVVDKKVCKRCGVEKNIKMFRTRSFGFTLNQCRQCEGELNKERRLKKQTTVVEEPQVITITTKSGKTVEASLKPIEGGRMTTSPKTDKVLYFNTTVSRDAARLAFSTFAEIERTGINFQKV